MHWTEVANRSSARLARISSRGGRRHAQRSSYLHGSGRGPCKYENRLSIRAPGEEEMRARNRALHSTRRRRVLPGAALMDCWACSHCARDLWSSTLVERAAWTPHPTSSSLLATFLRSAKRSAVTAATAQHSSAAWLRWLQIDFHRTGMRSVIVLIVAAHRAAAGIHARRHQRSQKRR